MMNLIDRAIIRLTLSLLVCGRLVAQENLEGKWISYSVTNGSKEVETKDKRDKVILKFIIDSKKLNLN